MAVPIVDGIDWDNFRYSPVYQGHEHFRGIFEWGFLYKESHVPKKELDKRTHNSEPYWYVLVVTQTSPSICKKKHNLTIWIARFNENVCTYESIFTC